MGVSLVTGVWSRTQYSFLQGLEQNFCQVRTGMNASAQFGQTRGSGGPFRGARLGSRGVTDHSRTHSAASVKKNRSMGVDPREGDAFRVRFTRKKTLDRLAGLIVCSERSVFAR